MDMVMGSMTVGGAIVGTLGGGARLAVAMPWTKAQAALVLSWHCCAACYSVQEERI